MAYYQPWTGPAAAYPVADTFADLREGTKRKRKKLLVKMPNAGEAGDRQCAHCGRLLRDPYPIDGDPDRLSQAEEESSWWVFPREKRMVGLHYYCSWARIMDRVLDLADEML